MRALAFLFSSIIAVGIFFLFLTASPSITKGQENQFIQFMRDSGTMGFANALLQEGLSPLSYDELLEQKQRMADSKSGTINITKLSAFGQVVEATGNDPVTFYIDEDLNENIIKKVGNDFVYGWDLVPPNFVQGIGPPPIPGALQWPVPGGRTTDVYGCSLTRRSVPCKGGTSWFHNGYDIDAPSCGDQITAAADGRVLRTGRDASYGNWIVISHETLGISTVYNHLSKIDVGAGQTVTKGQPIAKAGHTGYVVGSICGGEHLHFMVYVATPAFIGTTHIGTSVDPYPYLYGQ